MAIQRPGWVLIADKEQLLQSTMHDVFHHETAKGLRRSTMVVHVMQAIGDVAPEMCENYQSSIGRKNCYASSNMAEFPGSSVQLH
jgi:hypothetical protein